MLRLLSLTLLCGMAAGAVAAAETHPFSVHDMLAMDRIAEPRVSPDGRLVAFTVSVTDLAKNKRHSSLYLAAADGSFVRRLTAAEASDSQPRWSPDGKAIFFVSSRSGSSQVWRIALDGGEAEQVTRMPLDVDALEVGPGAKFLVFSMAVFPGKTPGGDPAGVGRQGAGQGERDGVRPPLHPPLGHVGERHPQPPVRLQPRRRPRRAT